MGDRENDIKLYIEFYNVYSGPVAKTRRYRLSLPGIYINFAMSVSLVFETTNSELKM